MPNTQESTGRVAGSFRDPSGFVFRDKQHTLLRQVNGCYESNYRKLIDSGLYTSLVDKSWLVEHDELDVSFAVAEGASRVLRPREIPFVSYPYEWPFTALKRAALLTLDIQQHALQHGMTLKDASNYNVQFEGVRPVFIDTLSFQEYNRNQPWDAYGQFCRHFVAPLALMAKTDARLNRLLMLNLDGVPLDLTTRLLPLRCKVSFGLQMHLYLHARMVTTYSNTSGTTSSVTVKRAQVSLRSQLAILDSLRRLITGLRLRSQKTQWSEYYSVNSYSEDGFEQKQSVVRSYLESVTPGTVWDLGANTGVFSRIAVELGGKVCAFDLDELCVEKLFRECEQTQTADILPLQIDLTNPSPALGWEHSERYSFVQRGPADTILALALIHHLAISNNVPLPQVADFLAASCRHLIIEFVPKTDPQVMRLLRAREDIFDEYQVEHFESAFLRKFAIVQREVVGKDGRVVYLMKKLQ